MSSRNSRKRISGTQGARTRLGVLALSCAQAGMKNDGLPETMIAEIDA
jgi:hypothetical protein